MWSLEEGLVSSGDITKSLCGSWQLEHREATEHTAMPQENTHKTFLVEGSVMLRNLPYRKAAVTNTQWCPRDNSPLSATYKGHVHGSENCPGNNMKMNGDDGVSGA